MKLTKKAAALLLAASLAVSVCATPVFATDPTMGSHTVNGTFLHGSVTGNYGTHVLYNVTERYTWTVPVTIDFGENAGANNTSTVEATLANGETGEKAKKETEAKTWKGTAPKITVTQNVIRANKKLQITVDTNGHTNTTYEGGKFYVVTDDTNEKLYYTITKPAKGSTPATELGAATNEVLLVPSGTDTDEQELVFKLTTAEGVNAAEKAGSYEGYVWFSSELVD